MTPDEFPKGWKARLIEASKVMGALTIIIGGIIAAVGWSTGTFGDAVRALIALPEWMESINEDMEVMREDLSTLTTNHEQLVVEVDRATQPRVIFQIDAEYTQPRGGFCVGFSRCILDVRMRRTIEGEQCKFLKGRDRYFFIDSSGQRIEVERIDGQPDPDIGREWFDFHWEFDTPGRMLTPVAFEFQRAYTNCRDPKDQAVIFQSSDPIDIDVRDINIEVEVQE